MMSLRLFPRLVPLVFLALAACKEDTATLPPPVALTAEAVGHYCQMDLLEHPGPKAQVHLEGMPYPLFFSQVRDAVAYRQMPEQSHAIVAIYVNDMAAAPSWEDTGAENWIDANTAVYVTGAAIAGGMGEVDLVPFATIEGAQHFIARHGGTVLAQRGLPRADALTSDQDFDALQDDDAADFLQRMNAAGRMIGG
jgi:copper chaperone NosL